jgi:hypothetical protein
MMSGVGNEGGGANRKLAAATARPVILVVTERVHIAVSGLAFEVVARM